MLYNYLKILVRSFYAERSYSLIIVFGFAVGLSCVLMIAQYIHFEKSFDKHVPDADRIFYTYMHWEGSDEIFDVTCHSAVAPLINAAVAGVSDVARLAPIAEGKGHETLIRWGDGFKSYSRESDLWAIDPVILRMFGISFIKGNPAAALREPHTVILTDRLSRKLFSDKDPLEQMLQVQSANKVVLFKVVGVVEDPSANSSLQFNALFSLQTFQKLWSSLNAANEWQYPAYTTYIKLESGAQADEIERSINQAAAVHLQKLYEKFHIRESIRLYPLTEFHFYQPSQNEWSYSIEFTGDERMLVFFAVLGILILVISWSNYINLTTARSLERAKEVGIRKTSGASKRQIVLQFLGESFALNLLGMLVALTITQLSFELFADALGSKASWTLWRLPVFWIVLLLFISCSTIISGLYPAFIISRYHPAAVLKGKFSRSPAGSLVRRILVTTQFVFAVLLMLSIYTITRQVILLQGKKVGMIPEQVLVIRAMSIDTAVDRRVALQHWRNRIGTRTDVVSTTAGYSYPGEVGEGYQSVYRWDQAPKDAREYGTRQVSSGYFSTLGMTMLEGRDFNNNGSDTSKVVVNDLAAKMLGYASLSDAVGERVVLNKNGRIFEIVGVSKSAQASIKWPMIAMVYFYESVDTNPTLYFNYFFAKLKSETIPETLSSLQRDWDVLFPGAPFDYFFLNDFFYTFCREERQFAGVFAFFAVVGVVITCMGLFGLNLYNINTRSKEIGVRKTMGASALNIMWLFTSGYLKLILFAALVSVPVGIWALNAWLANYPNRISMGVDVVLVPIGGAIAVSVLTVIYHTYKTAITNPVKALRSD